MKTAVGLKPAIISGVLAGIVFLMAEMVMLAMAGQSPFGPPRMMAAMVMGEGVLPPPATFDLMIMMVAMAVHMILSIAFAFVFGVIYSRMGRSMAVALLFGAVFGLVMYFLNFYVMTAVFPWFEMARGMIGIVGHVMFGLVLGWAYHKWSGVDASA
ncbi:hypothetical protein OAS19_00240 [Altererythrobacter sp.]|nr:hypothetical protein [Altererythrobacter sp.]